MDTEVIISVLQESIFMIVVFCLFLGFSMVRGRQSLINLILALYLALLISLKFPYFHFFVGKGGGQSSDSIVMIIIFIVFTIAATTLFGRLMPTEPGEPAFEGFGKKVLFAVMATVLFMAYSYHALPVTDLITPGSPIHALFGPEQNFFWWLIIPLIGLFLL